MAYSSDPKHYINFLIKKFVPKVDEITFKIYVNNEIDENGYDVDPFAHTDIIVNGKSLFERLKEYETSEAKRTKTDTKLAGMYVGIEPDNLLQRLNEGSTDDFSVWQCSTCRSSLCAAHLVCDFKSTPLYFELSNFRQVTYPLPMNNPTQHEETIYKTKWNYVSFRPYRFNKSATIKELTKAMEL